mmetsp:Transcript_116110/g.335343  ORF Transcript_116110/g.335343 Transcript_116110/m.335343 type:complete len:211 (+) Transcript_116110:835-1467(+)
MSAVTTGKSGFIHKVLCCATTVPRSHSSGLRCFRRKQLSLSLCVSTMMMPSHSARVTHSWMHCVSNLCPGTGSVPASLRAAPPLPAWQFVEDCVGQGSAVGFWEVLVDKSWLVVGAAEVIATVVVAAAAVVAAPAPTVPAGKALASKNLGLIHKSFVGLSSHSDTVMFLRRWQLGVALSCMSRQMTASHPAVALQTCWQSFMLTRAGHTI